MKLGGFRPELVITDSGGARLLADTVIDIATFGIADFYPSFFRGIFRENVSLDWRLDSSGVFDDRIVAHEVSFCFDRLRLTWTFATKF